MSDHLVTKEQAESLAELYTWEAVVSILEGSNAPRSESGQQVASEVIGLAKAEQSKLIRIYDQQAKPAGEVQP
ncbi:hypothetical protein [Xanthomonas sp. BRIP62411]|uniref:hypothetical protein n=1 Tax=Xanthomonas sp. BRIP62411 TaxID=2182389 RepID=UPI000F8EB7F4|nr:hypothetical protein [Xanthomonas sp. BRIP62411]